MLPAPARSTSLKNNSEQSAFKNPLLGALNALNGRSAAHFWGTYHSFAHSVRLFSASVAHQNFNVRLEKCVFPVYEPSWKPPFSIRCSIECILNELFIFSHWFVHHLVKNASWFCKFYENVLPALGGKHIFEERFLPVSCARPCFHTQTGFKITTFRGAFPPCAVQKMIFFADWAENGPPGKLSFTSLLISHAFGIESS